MTLSNGDIITSNYFKNPIIIDRFEVKYNRYIVLFYDDLKTGLKSHAVFKNHDYDKMVKTAEHVTLKDIIS